MSILRRRIDLDFCKRIERAEARGIRSAVEHGRDAFPERGLFVTEIAGASVCFAGVDSPFSQTVGLGIDAEVNDSDIEAIIDVYRSRGAQARVIASPIAGEALVRKLANFGFQLDEYANVLVADLADVRAARDSRVEICTDAKTWAERSSRGFADGEEPPEPMHFVALLMATHPAVTPLVLRENGEIATTACMAIEEDGIAALFATSTKPEARGRGYQTAMIQDRLARAIEAGATIARAGAKPGTTSERNFRGCGFSVLYTRTEWTLQ